MTPEKHFEMIKECLLRGDSSTKLINEINELEKFWDIKLYSSLLKVLTHLDFSPKVARENWEKILSHRTILSQKLKRDPGLMVATLDYFNNIDTQLTAPKIIEIAIYEETERNALLDGLTELYNHRYFKKALDNAIKTSKRDNEAVSILMCDLDDFKSYNDTYGHFNGDRVLVALSDTLRSCVRPSDIVARYGGEEFAVIMPKTDKFGASVLAERLMKAIREMDYSENNLPLQKIVTMSCGIASYPIDAADSKQLFANADKAMYQSKFDGKDTITLFSIEKRKHFRVDINQDIRIEKQVTAKQYEKVKLLNISASGAALESPKEIPKNTEIKMVLDFMKNGKPIELVGKVNWKKSEGKSNFLYGVQFIQLDQSMKKQLSQLVAVKQTE